MSLARRTASSASATATIGATGPKISSLSIRASSGTSASTVGSVEVAGAARALCRRSGLGALRDGVVDELGDLVALVVVDQRADVDAVVGAAADLERAHALGRACSANSSATDSCDVEAVGRRAGLADVAHLGDHRALDRGVEVGVVEDEERARCRRAPSRPLSTLVGGLLDQLAADLGGAGEATACARAGRRSSAPMTVAGRACAVTTLSTPAGSPASSQHRGQREHR